MTWEMPFQPSQAASFRWDSCGEPLWSSQLSELCAILKTKVSSWFLISSLRLFSYKRRFSLFIYCVFPQCWFRSGPPRRIEKSWLFHSGIVGSVSTLPVHSVIWDHQCLLHTVVAVEGGGELSSVSQTDASQWGEAVVTEGSVLVTLTSFSSGDAGDRRAGWRLTSTVPVLAPTLSPGDTCEGTEEGTAFLLVTLRDSLFSTIKSWAEFRKGKTISFSFPAYGNFAGSVGRVNRP